MDPGGIVFGGGIKSGTAFKVGQELGGVIVWGGVTGG